MSNSVDDRLELSWTAAQKKLQWNFDYKPVSPGSGCGTKRHKYLTSCVRRSQDHKIILLKPEVGNLFGICLVCRDQEGMLIVQLCKIIANRTTDGSLLDRGLLQGQGYVAALRKFYPVCLYKANRCSAAVVQTSAHLMLQFPEMRKLMMLHVLLGVVSHFLLLSKMKFTGWKQPAPQILLAAQGSVWRVAWSQVSACWNATIFRFCKLRSQIFNAITWSGTTPVFKIFTFYRIFTSCH